MSAYIVLALAGAAVFAWAAYYFTIFGSSGDVRSNHLPAAESRATLEDGIRILEQAARPAVGGYIGDEPPSSANGSQVGGSVFLPEGLDYPTDRNGNPMVFLVQVNFGDAPSVKGLPTTGIVQLFATAENDLGVPSLNYPKGDVAVFYWPDANSLSVAHDPIDLPHPEDVLVFASSWGENGRDMVVPLDIHRRGRVIVFEESAHCQLPLPYDYPVSARLYDLFGGRNIDAALYDYVVSARPPTEITLGGYPDFTQSDPRFPGIRDERGFVAEDFIKRDTPEYDQALLTLRSVDKLSIWDAGSLNLMTKGQSLTGGRIEEFLYEVSGH